MSAVPIVAEGEELPLNSVIDVEGVSLSVDYYYYPEEPSDSFNPGSGEDLEIVRVCLDGDPFCTDISELLSDKTLSSISHKAVASAKEVL